MAVKVPPQLRDPSLWRSQSFINGEWTAGNGTFPVLDPGSGQVIGDVAKCGPTETALAIEQSHVAYLEWRNLTGAQRGGYLAKLALLMRDNIEDLATIIALENGKTLADAKGECMLSIGQLEWMAAEAERGYGDVIPSAIPNVRNVVIKQGVGVAAIITPWNFPQAMIVRKAAAAFAAGATVVAKAPRETPFSSLAFAVLCERAGLPKGVYNVITTGDSSAVGKVMCEHDLVKKISFTGSTGVGRVLMRLSASTLKKCSFELGGNAPFIVFKDADLQKAVDSAAAVKFRCSGQVCIALNRLLVHEDIHEEFVTALVKKVNAFKVGHGLAIEVTHGPLINEKAVEKVESQVLDAVAKGGQIVAGGKRGAGNFYEPTVVTGCSPDMLVSNDETFGPLCAIYKFKSDEEAIALANDTEYGLAGYFFSQDISRVWRVAEALEVGMVGVNGAPVSQACAPFGGVKQSGFGREGSRYGLEEFQNVKLIAMTV